MYVRYDNIDFRTEPTATQQINQSPLSFRESKQPSDMADVLLSLKHAVVHPGQQLGTEKYENQQHMYHPQVLLSPTGYSSGICDQSFTQQPPMFPSMSVNVSMNMTMHGYHPNSTYPAAEVTCPQVSLKCSYWHSLKIKRLNCYSIKQFSVGSQSKYGTKSN